MLINYQVATAPCTDPLQEPFQTFEAKPVRPQTTCFFKICGSIIRREAIPVRRPKPGLKSRPAEAI